MKRFLGVILVALFALGGIAGPASADPLDDLEFSTVPPVDQIPFAVPVEVTGTREDIRGTGVNPGFVGVCDVELQCVGLSTQAAVSDGYVAVTDAKVIIRGVICVDSERAPCGALGSPMTGVVTTERTYDIPEGEIQRPMPSTQTCVWRLDPRFSPGACTKDIVDTIVVDAVDLGTTYRVELPATEAFLGVEAVVPDRILIGRPIL